MAYTQSFNNPANVGDTATFALPAGCYLVGFDPVDPNEPGGVTMTDTVASSVVLTLSPLYNRVLSTLGSSFKFTITGSLTQPQQPVKFLWVARARDGNSV